MVSETRMAGCRSLGDPSTRSWLHLVQYWGQGERGLPRNLPQWPSWQAGPYESTASRAYVGGRGRLTGRENACTICRSIVAMKPPARPARPEKVKVTQRSEGSGRDRVGGGQECIGVVRASSCGVRDMERSGDGSR